MDLPGASALLAPSEPIVPKPTLSRRMSRTISRLPDAFYASVISEDGSHPATALSRRVRQGLVASRLIKTHNEAADPEIEATLEKKTAAGAADSQALVKRPPTLLSLPTELQVMLLHHLAFADLERLRRTCRHFAALVTPQLLRTIIGQPRLQSLLLSHCRECLRYDPGRDHLLLAPLTGPDGCSPLSSRCIDCAEAAPDRGGICVGTRLPLANFDLAWPCRWCAWPVVIGSAGELSAAANGFFLLGWIQLALGIVAAALAWRYYRNEMLVFAPTVTSFILLWICLHVLMFRGNRVRTYHYTFVIEFSILCLWIPPVYFIGSRVAHNTGWQAPASEIASLTIFALNIIFRFLNVLGNVVLLVGYDRTWHHKPRVPFWREKFLNPIMSGLIFWTYPQSAEQKYPPDYN